MQQNKIKHLE